MKKDKKITYVTVIPAMHERIRTKITRRNEKKNIYIYNHPYLAAFLPPPSAPPPLVQGENVARIDAVIAEQFGTVVRQAAAGELTQAWRGHPRSLLALIVVLDQFSRYVRGIPRERG